MVVGLIERIDLESIVSIDVSTKFLDEISNPTDKLHAKETYESLLKTLNYQSTRYFLIEGSNKYIDILKPCLEVVSPDTGKAFLVALKKSKDNKYSFDTAHVWKNHPEIDLPLISYAIVKRELYPSVGIRFTAYVYRLFDRFFGCKNIKRFENITKWPKFESLDNSGYLESLIKIAIADPFNRFDIDYDLVIKESIRRTKVPIRELKRNIDFLALI
ncbi:hypothetical protein DRJ17_05915 [Candidatus Woesearchaeota archaeon]|nr:MAG: hypothetical protein DRJ17_05915 [Candidatus Woesearchaeota archaeon]